MRLKKRLALATAVGMTLAMFGATPASAAPSNDNFADAILVASLPRFDGAFDASEATLESGDPNPSCDYEDGTHDHTAWWTFTPSQDTSLGTDAVGFDATAFISVWTGTHGSLTEVACSDGSAIFDATGGTAYYFMTSTCCGEPGTVLDFVLSEVTPIEMTVTIDGTGRVNRQTNEVTVSGTLTCNQPLGVELFGTVRQRAGRSLISGDFFSFVECDDSGPFAWEGVTENANGIFVSGRATVRVFAFTCSIFECVEIEGSRTIRLRP